MINDGREINASSIKNSLRGFTTRVVYDNALKENIINDILQIALQSTLEYENGIIEGIVSSFKYLLPLMKNDSFSEEMEKRFIHQSTNDCDSKPKVNFRIRNGIILPYINLKLLDCNNQELYELPINDIVVGPSRNQSHIIDSIMYFLDKSDLGYLKNIVRGSMIPYRGLIFRTADNIVFPKSIGFKVCSRRKMSEPIDVGKTVDVL